MATRMQQRRGTAAQWSAVNPVLAAGEIGFITDTGQFKIGDGVNAWSSLGIFKDFGDLDGSGFVLDSEKGQPNGVATLNSDGSIPLGQLAALIAGAPDTLNTLAEIGDYAQAIEDVVTSHNAATTDVHGIANTANLATLSAVQSAVEAEAGNRTLAIQAEASDRNDAIQAAADSIALDIATSEGLANSYTDGKISDEVTNRNAAIAESISDHNDLTENVHGIGNTELLATKEYAEDKADAAELAATTAAGTAADTKISTHNSETTNVHGIANTAVLATATTVATAKSEAIADAGTAADTKISTAVAALTKTSVGLGNVDNTSDANKPVSTATQTALDLKAPKAAPTFTGTLTAADVTISGNLTVSGTTTTVNTTNFTTSDPLIYLGEGNNANLVDLGFVGSYNDGTYAHQGFVKDSSDGKWKLFKGVTDEPTTTINFAQGSLDALKVGAFEATTVTPSSGIVFSDGTQIKVGVPSITTFATEISSSATLATGEQDKFVPLSGAVTITLPATGYSTGQSIDFYQASGTGAAFASTNSVVGTPGLKLRTTNSVATAMKTPTGWLVFGDLSA